MSKLIILRGNSGSGKTTIAKELQKQFGRNTMVISQDVVRRDMLKVRDGECIEAEHMYKRTLELGIPEEDIILENTSKSTVENILCALVELQRTFWLNRVSKVLLVTTTYHMRRSLAIARYLFPEHIDIVPCPADDVNTKRDNWMNTPKGIERARGEANNIVSCIKNGVIPDFEI